MNVIKKITAFLLAASCIANSGCSNKATVTPKEQQTVITLAWWGNDVRNDYTIKAMDLFQEQNPDIKVKCSYSEWSGYEARNRVRMISETEEDVMQINASWIPQYSPKGKGYYNLDELYNIIDLSTIPAEYLKFGRVRDKLNGIPIAMNAETVYINKTIYNKYGLDIPKTWDDFFTAAKAMKDDRIYPLSVNSKSLWLLTISYAEQQSGRSFLNEDGSFGFTDSELKMMIDFYRTLVDERVIPQVEYYDKLNIVNGSYAGTVAWASDAVNYCGNAIDNGYEMIPVDYPTNGKVQSGEGWYAKPASFYAISKNTEHPEEAAKLMNFMLNSKEMALLQGVEKGIPISIAARSYLDEAGMLTGIQYDASLVMENNPNLKHMDPFMENATLIDKFIQQSNLVIYEKSTSEDAAQVLLHAITKALESSA
ncbi:MAG: carbohydrate ABC transporter substrate-binding protein [Ruminococcus sp.]|nr:carbohydrate ABC transporter substrate-binding protein [Ruminococcus sp.]